MVARWKIYLMIAFIAIGAIPILMVCVGIPVPPWALIAGHFSMIVVGFVCAEWSKEAVCNN